MHKFQWNKTASVCQFQFSSNDKSNIDLIFFHFCVCCCCLFVYIHSVLWLKTTKTICNQFFTRSPGVRNRPPTFVVCRVDFCAGHHRVVYSVCSSSSFNIPIFVAHTQIEQLNVHRFQEEKQKCVCVPQCRSARANIKINVVRLSSTQGKQ